jgi:hypothetical protein
LIVLGSAAALAAAAVAGGESPLRTLVSCWFLLACPGLAVAPLILPPSAQGEWTLVPSISVAIDIVVGSGLMYAGLWSPVAIFVLLTCICAAGAALQLRPPRRAPG